MKQKTQCHSLLPGVNSLQFLSAFCLFPSCCVVQLLSHVQLFATHTRLPCPLLPPGACSDSCSLSWCCHPTISSSVVPFSSCLQSFPESESFPSESVLCIRWPKYRRFSFSISPSKEYSGLISLRIDWFDLLAVQETPKSLFQHHSSAFFIVSSFLYSPAFFIVQLSHPHITIGKTIVLTRRTLLTK